MLCQVALLAELLVPPPMRDPAAPDCEETDTARLRDAIDEANIANVSEDGLQPAIALLAAASEQQARRTAASEALVGVIEAAEGDSLEIDIDALCEVLVEARAASVTAVDVDAAQHLLEEAVHDQQRRVQAAAALQVASAPRELDIDVPLLRAAVEEADEAGVSQPKVAAARSKLNDSQARQERRAAAVSALESAVAPREMRNGASPDEAEVDTAALRAAVEEAHTAAVPTLAVTAAQEKLERAVELQTRRGAVRPATPPHRGIPRRLRPAASCRLADSILGVPSGGGTARARAEARYPQPGHVGRAGGNRGMA
jgi:hypothetical protein